MTAARPLVVAHRAGNDLAGLARAAAAGADIVELDVHPYRGRLEVRHTKTLGPAPVLWDRWYLADGLAPALHLEEVLAAMAAAPAAPTPMIDLKGGDPRLAGLVGECLDRAWPAGRPVLVCGRVWRTLARLAGRPGVGVVHSAGSPRQLRRLLARFPEGPGLEGASVHMRLLDPGTVAALRARTPLVLTWPVNDPGDARRLAGWGVTGLISDVPEDLGLT